VAIVDRSPAYHRGLSVALAEQGFAVAEPDDLAKWLRTDAARAVLWTIGNEHDLTRFQAAAALPVRAVTVALLTEVTPRAYGAALRSGGHAAVGRDAPLAEITEVLRAALKGRAIMPVAVARALAVDGSGCSDLPITSAEARWIQSLARGRTVSSVARDAGYSDRAMHRHLQSLYRRLGAATRAEALVRAARLGLLDGEAATDEPAHL